MQKRPMFIVISTAAKIIDRPLGLGRTCKEGQTEQGTQY